MRKHIHHQNLFAITIFLETNSGRISYAIVDCILNRKRGFKRKGKLATKVGAIKIINGVWLDGISFREQYSNAITN